MNKTIRSNKDGQSGDRGTSFASYEPNTYSIEEDGKVIGSITQNIMQFKSLNPNWSGSGVVWTATLEDGTEFSSQSFNEVRAEVKKW